MMAALLDEGAGDLDATAFAEARESLAARFGFSADRDDVRPLGAVADREPRRQRGAAARARSAEPRFDPEAVARVQGADAGGLRDRPRPTPRPIASRAFYADAFPGPPLRPPDRRHRRASRRLDIEALRAAHDARAGARPAAGRGGGRHHRRRARAAARPAVRRPSGAAARRCRRSRRRRRRARCSVIDLDIPQSIVLFGQAGIARDDPDFIPAFVMDYILGGGGFGSRLTEEVREKRGLTYGIDTWLVAERLRLALHRPVLQRQRPGRRGARDRARRVAAHGRGRA